MIKAVVFDLDGVIRIWNHHETFAIEDKNGIPRSTIFEHAFEDGLNHRATVGAITDEEWRDTVAATVAELYGDPGRDAVIEWRARVGALDAGVLELIAAVRSHLTVALLTNATTRLSADMNALELNDTFDVVFNSSSIGLAKPSKEVFEFVGAQLGLAPEEWLFTDDTEVNVVAANALGIRSHRYATLVDLKTWLTQESGIAL